MRIFLFSKTFRYHRILCILFVTATFVAVGQPRKSMVRVVVAPNHPDWTYRTGEIPSFKISVLHHDTPITDVKITYQIGPEKMEPVQCSSFVLTQGDTTIDGTTMQTPGFLRCIVVAEVDGKRYKGLATAGFEPQRITPTTDMPSDFHKFWKDNLGVLRSIPLKAKMERIPDRCTDMVDVYHVRIQNYGQTYIFGVLCVPKGEKSLPALLKLPGAGVRAYTGDIAMAEKGMITFQIGIHGIPVNLQSKVYENLRAGALDNYQYINLDDRDRYYYKRVYLGCVRAVDFLFSLPQFNKKDIGVAGGSQGGALSIVTAALDPRITCVAALAPGLCDLTGYLHGRAGGSRMFDKNNGSFNTKPDKVATSKYYDVVNFAQTLDIPGFYSWGFNDETCPPTTMYAAYNVIKSPKQLFLAYDANHWYYPEQWERANNWLMKQLNVR